MALTSRVKEELSTVAVKRSTNKAAEAVALLRFGGGVEVSVTGVISYMCSFDSPETAQRLVRTLRELWGISASTSTSGTPGGRRAVKTIVVVDDEPEMMLRRTGLVTRAGSLVVGLPPTVISGTVDDAEAAWRGAFLARGSLTEPGRASALEISCPSPESALAMVGLARRMGVSAKTKETRSGDRVIVRDGESIGALLTRMGAQVMRLEWEDKRMHREVRGTANRLANFDDANIRRSAQAAVAAAARVERAFEILGDDVQDHLVEAGQLRITYRLASLEELGRHADPPMTKDAVAGRIRRLLATADKQAELLGIPPTSAAVTESVLAEATTLAVEADEQARRAVEDSHGDDAS